jgi:glutamine synthetase
MESSEPPISSLNKLDATKVFFTDLNGRLMSLSVNPHFLEQIYTNGTGIDGSSIAGMTTVDNSDNVLFPVKESFKEVEFGNKRIGFFVGSLHETNHERAKCDPREVLERVLKQAREKFGVTFTVGPEHEFFLLTGDEYSSDIHIDKSQYFGSGPDDTGEPVREKIVEVLGKCGINYEKMHHEVTPSQQEINLEPGDPLTIADRTVLFTHVTKEVAAEFGLHATFMCKPFNGLNRNAFHMHTSMQDEKGNNLFYDANAKYNMSTQMRQFMGGIIKYARETSIVMASTVNSYKAYVLDKEAPIMRGWGLNNRSSLIRIPHIINPSSMRFELRSPDATGNVYLQFAAMIAMGLKGMEEELDCGEPDDGNNYKLSGAAKMRDDRLLPRDMFEALWEAEESNFLKELLGEELYTNYMKLKMDDWEAYRTHVTSREHKYNLAI